MFVFYLGIAFLTGFAVVWTLRYALRPTCPECRHKIPRGARRCLCGAVFDRRLGEHLGGEPMSPTVAVLALLAVGIAALAIWYVLANLLLY